MMYASVLPTNPSIHPSIHPSLPPSSYDKPNTRLDVGIQCEQAK